MRLHVRVLNLRQEQLHRPPFNVCDILDEELRLDGSAGDEECLELPTLTGVEAICKDVLANDDSGRQHWLTRVRRGGVSHTTPATICLLSPVNRRRSRTLILARVVIFTAPSAATAVAAPAITAPTVASAGIAVRTIANAIAAAVNPAVVVAIPAAVVADTAAT